MNHSYHYWFLLLCYTLVFLTGDKRWLYRSIYDDSSPYKGKHRFIVAVGIAAHMGLLVSPLSMSGILLIIVLGSSGVPTLHLVALIGAMTIGITQASSLLLSLISEEWLGKVSAWFKHYSKPNKKPLLISKNKTRLIFLLLLLAELLFLLIKPQSNSLSELSYIQKILPVRFPMFFALVMLAIGALVMLCCKIKPVQILETCQFKLGIQQFFICLGLTWLLNTLINHDKGCLAQIFDGTYPGYGFYLVAGLYSFLIDLPILIWLFSPLLKYHCTMLTLALWLVFIHSLAPIGYWIRRIFEPYKKSR